MGECPHTRPAPTLRVGVCDHSGCGCWSRPCALLLLCGVPSPVVREVCLCASIWPWDYNISVDLSRDVESGVKRKRAQEAHVTDVSWQWNAFLSERLAHKTGIPACAATSWTWSAPLEEAEGMSFYTENFLHQMDLRILSYDSIFCVTVSIPFLVSPIKNIKLRQSQALLMMHWKVNLTLRLVSVVDHLQYVRFLYYVISKYLPVQSARS